MPKYTDPETGKSFSSLIPLDENELEEAFSLVSESLPATTEPTWGEALSTGFGAEKAFGFGKQVISPIVHPIQTMKGLGEMGRQIGGGFEPEKFSLLRNYLFLVGELFSVLVFL